MRTHNIINDNNPNDMDIDITPYKQEFITLLRSTGREGINDVIDDLEQGGFFNAPASAGHHLNVPGGLVLHSLNTCKAALAVWEGMKKVEPWLEKEVTRESVIIASLLHDVCKMDVYYPTVKRRKNAMGVWEDAPGWKVSYRKFPMGHGEKSLVLLLCDGLELTDAEMLAIRWHMGPWGVNMNSFEDQRNYDTAHSLYPLVMIIHTADCLAASIMERDDEELADM